MIFMLLGSKIQQILKEQNITQRELAEALHLNPNTVNGYIRGRRFPDCETLSRIAAFLDTNTDYLLGNTNLRSYPDLSLNVEEGLLISNYRAMDEDRRRILLELSSSLYLHSRAFHPPRSSENNSL